MTDGRGWAVQKEAAGLQRGMGEREPLVQAFRSHMLQPRDQNGFPIPYPLVKPAEVWLENFSLDFLGLLG